MDISSESLKLAEERMSQIEQRIQSLQSQKVVPTNHEDVNKLIEEALYEYEKKILIKLKLIKEELLNNNNNNITNNSDYNKLIEERDNAIAENIKNKKEIDKLNYRIQHLVKALNEEEEKNLR